MTWIYASSSALLMLFLLRQCDSAEEIIKCLKMPKEKIRLKCPRNHVIYHPVILAGVSDGETCARSHNDCVGVSEFIQRQVDKCNWKNSCKIKLCNNDTIECGQVTRNIDYVVIRQPHCIPKNIVMGICTRTKKKHNPEYSMGIILSHRRYPMRECFSQRTCSIDIHINSTKTLLLEDFTNDDKCAGKDYSINVYAVNKGNITKVDMTVNDTKKREFNGKTTERIKIEAEFVRSKRRCRGFMLPFKVYDTKSYDTVMTWPKSSLSIMKDLERIVQVRAVIEQCTVDTTGMVTLACGANEVIYSPEVSVSGYTRGTPKCIFGKYPCGGYTPGILVQRSSCYWRNTCNITWEGSDQIILSKQSRCIGFAASMIGLSGHLCVPRDNIFDLCTSVTKLIDREWGIIRSHPAYPWYFDTEFSECKRIIKIGKGKILLFTVQDMNLDPDGMDKFSVYHVKKRNRIRLMDAKTAKEGHHMTVEGGRLLIKFKPYPISKSGRGFILIFRKQNANNSYSGKRDVYGKTFMTGKEVVSDSADLVKVSNRRLCSGTSTDRRRGRACKPRVWTDYFTRLE